MWYFNGRFFPVLAVARRLDHREPTTGQRFSIGCGRNGANREYVFSYYATLASKYSVVFSLLMRVLVCFNQLPQPDSEAALPGPFAKMMDLSLVMRQKQ